MRFLVFSWKSMFQLNVCREITTKINEAQSEIFSLNLELFKARDIMQSPVITITSQETVAHLAHVLLETTHGGYPVVKFCADSQCEVAYGLLTRYGLFQGRWLLNCLYVVEASFQQSISCWQKLASGWWFAWTCDCECFSRHIQGRPLDVRQNANSILEKNGRNFFTYVRCVLSWRGQIGPLSTVYKLLYFENSTEFADRKLFSVVHIPDLNSVIVKRKTICSYGHIKNMVIYSRIINDKCFVEVIHFIVSVAMCSLHLLVLHSSIWFSSVPEFQTTWNEKTVWWFMLHLTEQVTLLKSPET